MDTNMKAPLCAETLDNAIKAYPQLKGAIVHSDRGTQYTSEAYRKEYVILTDELTRAWSGMTTRQYKNLKGLKKESLRDNMSTTELTLNQLAEVATREFSQQEKPQGFEQSKKIAKRGGSIAGNTRRDLEQELGRSLITSQNAMQLNHVVAQMIEASVSAITPSDASDDS